MLKGPGLTDAERAEAARREKKRAQDREYSKRPEVKARTNARRRERRLVDPDYRERIRTQQREYERRPEVNERINARRRERRRRASGEGEG